VRTLRRLAAAESRAHRGRTVAAIVTVALGAGVLTTTLVFADTMRTAVDDGLSVAYEGSDVVVRANQDSGVDEAGAPAGGNGIDQASVTKIARLPGVAHTSTYVRASGAAQVGKITRGIDLESLATGSSFVWQRWSEGRPPRAGNEVALTRASLDELKIGLGDQVALGNPDVGRSVFRVVGIVDVRGSLSRESSAYGVVTAPVAEALAGIKDPNVVLIKTRPGVKPATVVKSINAKAPVGWPESTHDLIEADSQAQGAQVDALSALVTGLAAVSLIVAAVTLATTTAAATNSRRRTIALARCIGADRGNLVLLVVLEVLLPSLAGAVLGVLAGVAVSRLALPLVGLVPGLPALRGSAFTAPLFDLLAPLIAAGFLAVLAAIIPAVLAARVPPSAALSSGPRPEPAHPHVTAATLTLAAAVLASFGAWGALYGPIHDKLWLLAAGAVLVLIGAALVLSPVLGATSRWLARWVDVPASRLALTDIVRRPGTASIEAVAIVLATGMVALSWVALSCIAATTSARLSASDQPDLVIGVPSGAPVVSDSVVSQLGSIDGVAKVVAVPYGRGVTIEGRGTRSHVSLGIGTVAADPAQLSTALPHGFALDRMRDDTVYLPTTGFPPFPEGRTVTLKGPNGAVKDLAVRYVKGLEVPSAVSAATMKQVSHRLQTRTAWIKAEPGTDRGRLSDEVSGIATLGGQLPVSGPLVVDVRTGKALAMARAAAAGILGVAVLVAVIGAAATTSLVVSERTREHAVLRALGLERRGLTRLLVTRVLLVGAVASAVGVVTGSVLGVMIGRAVARGLDLPTAFRLPLVPVIAIAVLTVLLVRAVAVIPLERASYIPPSRVLARE
jgi:putative ABC transport system permease protein